MGEGVEEPPGARVVPAGPYEALPATGLSDFLALLAFFCALRAALAARACSRLAIAAAGVVADGSAGVVAGPGAGVTDEVTPGPSLPSNPLGAAA